MPPPNIVEPQDAGDEVRALSLDSGPAPKILVVDDNPDAADALGALVQEFGHEVLVAYGPVEALAAAPGFGPDIAILDIGLQVMDGYELAGELRKRMGSQAPAMIALSGYGQESDRKRSAEAAFSAHLVKPVDLDALFASIAGARVVGH
ncbi:response regulator [Polaromonas sp. YR568]|uniref:response regulator n=1 Tax=Polaromonas sp. YR568 TaxID=1855301 RepID=UPI00398BD2C7